MRQVNSVELRKVTESVEFAVITCHKQDSCIYFVQRSLNGFCPSALHRHPCPVSACFLPVSAIGQLAASIKSHFTSMHMKANRRARLNCCCHLDVIAIESIVTAMATKNQQSESDISQQSVERLPLPLPLPH